MPTGYTSIFTERDVTFREYSLRCARAFGACILQRNDNIEEPPKHREEASLCQERVDSKQANDWIDVLYASLPEAR